MKTLDHKAVVKIKEVFSNSTHTIIIEEYLKGGSLDKRIAELDENKAKHIIYQVLDALCYIHEAGVLHRDIKMENIIFVDEERLNIKLVDFGLAEYALPGKVFNNTCGTIGYTAPEMHCGRGYGLAIDIWSVGVLAYALLMKKLPFKGANHDEITNATLDDEADFSGFSFFSLHAEEFVKELLQKDPRRRPTAEEALKSKWFL